MCNLMRAGETIFGAGSLLSALGGQGPVVESRGGCVQAGRNSAVFAPLDDFAARACKDNI